MQNQPKEEALGQIFLRTSSQKNRLRPPDPGKEDYGTDITVTSTAKLRSERLRADFFVPPVPY